MHRRRALQLLAGFACCPFCTTSVPAAESHWRYEGQEGPARWGELDPANRVCSLGMQQSPIDIGTTIRAQLDPIKIMWDKHAETIANNVHTIQLDIGDTSVLAYGETNYRFQQFHFHHPSEYRIAGKSFPMEVHFVHANARGSLAVIGVLMTAGRRTRPSARLSPPCRKRKASRQRPIRQSIRPDYCRRGAAITAIPDRSRSRPAARRWIGFSSRMRSRWHKPILTALPSSFP